MKKYVVPISLFVLITIIFIILEVVGKQNIYALFISAIFFEIAFFGCIIIYLIYKHGENKDDKDDKDDKDNKHD